MEGLLKRETDKDVYNFTLNGNETYLIHTDKRMWTRRGCILNFYSEFFTGSYLFAVVIDNNNKALIKCKEVAKLSQSSAFYPELAYQWSDGFLSVYLRFHLERGSIYVSKIGNDTVPRKKEIDFNALTPILIEA